VQLSIKINDGYSLNVLILMKRAIVLVKHRAWCVGSEWVGIGEREEPLTRLAYLVGFMDDYTSKFQCRVVKVFV